MKKRTVGFGLLIVVLGLAVILAAGCEGREPDKIIRQKFNTVAAADFKAILAEIPKENLADSVFFRIGEYSSYPKGRYGVRAVVDFYYLKGVYVKRTVKYRYVKKERKWERYANEYRTYNDVKAP
jgi:hypothetical protein